MKAIFDKCYDDWGNLKDNALNIAYNLGKKEGLRKGKKIARAEAIEEVKRLIDKRESEKCNMGSCDDCIMCCEVRALDWLFKQLKKGE